MLVINHHMFYIQPNSTMYLYMYIVVSKFAFNPLLILWKCCHVFATPVLVCDVSCSSFVPIHWGHCYYHYTNIHCCTCTNDSSSLKHQQRSMIMYGEGHEGNCHVDVCLYQPAKYIYTVCCCVLIHMYVCVCVCVCVCVRACMCSALLLVTLLYSQVHHVNGHSCVHSGVLYIVYCLPGVLTVS